MDLEPNPGFNCCLRTERDEGIELHEDFWGQGRDVKDDTLMIQQTTGRFVEMHIFAGIMGVSLLQSWEKLKDSALFLCRCVSKTPSTLRRAAYFCFRLGRFHFYFNKGNKKVLEERKKKKKSRSNLIQLPHPFWHFLPWSLQHHCLILCSLLPDWGRS